MGKDFFKYSLLLLLPLSLLTACNKQLNLAPENTLVESKVFSNEGSTEGALAEAYYNLFLAATGSVAYTIGDFTTPNVESSTFYDNYNNGTISPADESVKSVWEAYYKAINDANNLIVKIPKLGKFDENKEMQFVAEAKFIRAYAYLDLLKLFGEGALTGNMKGLGVPLQITPFEGYETGDVIPRSDNGTIYGQIVKDLQEAIPDLPKNYPDDLSTRTRATKGTANALLSRVYLYMQEYDKAAAAAKEVLNEHDVYALTENLSQLFPPALPSGGKQAMTSEYIFGFPVSYMSSASKKQNTGIGNSYYFKRDFWINPDFIHQFEPGDLRVSQLMFKGDSVYNPDAFGYLTTFKFNSDFGYNNVPAVRLPEVMLTRAEALARTGGINQESIDLLNKVRDRSLPGAVDYTTSDFSDKETLINTILLQRRFELAFEGFYRYDLIRTGQSLKNPNLPKDKLVLPIPQIEVDISNGLIKQNTGY